MLTKREKNRRKQTKHERNQKIVDLYSTCNYTIEEVIEKLGLNITKQCAHQIIKRAGIDGNLIAKERNRKKKKHKICENEGCQKRFYVKPSAEEQRFCSLECFGKSSRQYSDKELIEYLKELKRKHGKLTSSLIIEKAPPSYTTLRRRFGNIDTLREITEKNG